MNQAAFQIIAPGIPQQGCIDGMAVSSFPHAEPVEDWNSGERMWIIDWVAPFAHTKQMTRFLKRHLLANYWFKTLYHRRNEKKLIIKTFRGVDVMKQEAEQWFATHPVIEAQASAA
ncbi:MULTISPECIES: toxin-activating lysine-acyltransferase [unclassified Undibacterium]|uniref:toxin-activating lysine-acyltransferase n=1 Tax=unclassified Undibacterium TaxID=2630295 RepID=UPI002AC9D398|nr:MULTISPECIES: toxin-activating lysine-acyltransferase [unclassified Undibacterium]MEB0141179.1 toxin-activating lysine-acyltransferase [Undibacterium sp. CCC2.1]MEB0174218.1 toxin-activating lysine-acyltransferase [Undibacterium sp. CCC1.1]MEB0178160.1 toxin-activating lysine-acyltransferase [Undibacterium sp. CCC3.4]MEB0217390.1 toxin-activating lysine-acyltransferase [Undibacterium sp. 5I2]WPX42371.1 toxin-activating lysine-acyltransferase [Undibacterium sp. CCC3.4]